MPEEQQIKKLTVKEFLIDEYNAHIVTYVKNLIEATWNSGRPPDEIVITLIQPSGNPQIPGIERKIKAKEAQMQARKILDKEDSILKVIEKLIRLEDNKETKFN